MSKWFLVLSLHFLKIKQSDSVLLKRVWFGPCNSFGFFQTWWYSSRFGADAHRHQVYFGLSFKQVGLWFIHPLSFGSSPPLSRLIRLYSSPSTSLPLSAPNSFGESLLLFYILWSVLIICYADPMRRIAWNTSIFSFWWFSLDAKIGCHLGGI